MSTSRTIQVIIMPFVCHLEIRSEELEKTGYCYIVKIVIKIGTIVDDVLVGQQFEKIQLQSGQIGTGR
jgi:hypothetical protein